MGRYRCGKPRTDQGTIILHWLLVALLIIAAVTGLGISCNGTGCDWIMVLWGATPSATIWAEHVGSGFMLTVVAVAYPVYIWRARLVPRVVLDRVRLSQLARRRYRWAAINVMFNWVCHLAILAELVSGGLLLSGRAAATLLEVHQIGAWIIFAYGPLHVLAHFAYGGLPQLLRLFRPIELPPRRPRLDHRSE